MASFHPLILHVTRVYFVGHHQCLEGFGTGRERIRRMAAFGAAEVRNVYNNYTSTYTASSETSSHGFETDKTVCFVHLLLKSDVLIYSVDSPTH